MRTEIRDSRSTYLGWSVEVGNDIQYFGVTKGYIGRYSKTDKRWWWMQGPKAGQLGPRADIGYGEVLAAEGGK